MGAGWSRVAGRAVRGVEAESEFCLGRGVGRSDDSVEVGGRRAG